LTHPPPSDFTIVSATGSKLIQNRVFHRLLESEEQAGDSSNRKHTELGPDNYTFSLAGTEGTNYVLNVEPKEESRFLYRGKIWVDAHDFAVTRIEAQPARNPSFWTTKSVIHHTYQKVDNGFYLPKENKTVTSVRLGGRGDSDHRIPVLSGDRRQARCIGKKNSLWRGMRCGQTVDSIRFEVEVAAPISIMYSSR
jgi:hypothetical protein